MNNRRLALLLSMCVVLLGLAMAKQPTFTSAKVQLTQTPSPSGSTPTATPSCFPQTPVSPDHHSQERIPNLTATPTPNATLTPTATADPCFVQPELILSGPSQVQLGQVFTISIQYINLGMPQTKIRFNDTSLAQFDPPLTMPCKYDQHPTGCRSITVRATNVGTLVINATANGESYNHGWYWGSGSARNPLSIIVFNPNGNETITPTPTCVVNPPTPSPFVFETSTPTLVEPRVPNLTPTFPPTATPNDPCFIEPKVILTAPSQVEVGDLFTISVQYINLARPSAYLDVWAGTAHFEPPTNEICFYDQHPTQCRSFTMRATGVGVVEFDLSALGEAYYNGGWHSIWIHAQAPAVINIVGDAVTSTPTVIPIATCVPPTATPIPTVEPTIAGQATTTSTPIQTRTATPTPIASPCWPTLYSELVLHAPSQVQVGDIFTLTIEYRNISGIRTTISLSPNGLAQFDPPLAMPCDAIEHDTNCKTITMRANAVGELTIDASAFGVLFIDGQQSEDGYAHARNPVYINILPNNAMPTRTPTPTATQTPTPCPTNVANSGCSGTPTITPINGNATATPIVSALILSAPWVVNVGDVFTLTIQYVNVGMPYTRVTNWSDGIGQFDPPLAMPCKFNQHPTQCRTIRLRATAAGSLHLSASATGEVPIAGGGWGWGHVFSNPISIQVHDVIAYRIFIPAATK